MQPVETPATGSRARGVNLNPAFSLTPPTPPTSRAVPASGSNTKAAVLCALRNLFVPAEERQRGSGRIEVRPTRAAPGRRLRSRPQPPPSSRPAPRSRAPTPTQSSRRGRRPPAGKEPPRALPPPRVSARHTHVHYHGHRQRRRWLNGGPRGGEKGPGALDPGSSEGRAGTSVFVSLLPRLFVFKVGL